MKGRRLGVSRSPMRLSILVGWLLPVAVIPGFAALPPKYLEIPQFDRCLAEQDQGGYRTWCLPDARPAACPEASWKALEALRGGDQVPPCTGIGRVR